MSPVDQVERFRPTNGRVLGTLGLVLCAVVVVTGVVERDLPLPAVTGALVVAVLLWTSTLRPRVMVVGRLLVLRGMLETTSIPLAAVEDVVVRQVLAVRACGRRFVSPAVGRSLRQTMRSPGAPPAAGSAADGRVLATASYADVVEDRIRRLAQDAAAAEGVERYSEEQEALAAQVHRRPAWPEIALLLLALVAFAVSFAL